MHEGKPKKATKVLKQVMGNMWRFFFASLYEEQNTIEEIVTKRFFHPLTLFFKNFFNKEKQDRGCSSKA
jgi:hypothetical protein